MYIFLSVLLILLFFVILFSLRKKFIIKKIRRMDPCQKCILLNELIEPFGYCYDSQQDLFSSRIDAWQRDFGYSWLYDRTAPRFHLIFDCAPIYFDYGGKTWLLEFWKGQYGINTGGEIGLYCSDTLVVPKNRKATLFHSVSNDEMLDFSFRLCKCGPIAEVCARHWWLTGFLMGEFSRPEDLCMDISITFPNREMLEACLRGLEECGYSHHSLWVCKNTLRVCFTSTFPVSSGWFYHLTRSYAQWMNHRLCRMFLWITRPFCSSLDRLLYLSFFLPFAFRRTIRLHGRKRRCKKYRCKRQAAKVPGSIP